MGLIDPAKARLTSRATPTAAAERACHFSAERGVSIGARLRCPERRRRRIDIDPMPNLTLDVPIVNGPTAENRACPVISTQTHVTNSLSVKVLRQRRPSDVLL